jgi:ABC-type Mn2+/Zn2+ transport system permease subunit
MLIGPGAVGLLMARRFDRVLLVAMATALGSSVAGTLASFHLDIATAPLIVVMQSALFAAALGLNLWRARALSVRSP